MSDPMLRQQHRVDWGNSRSMTHTFDSDVAQLQTTRTTRLLARLSAWLARVIGAFRPSPAVVPALLVPPLEPVSGLMRSMPAAPESAPPPAALDHAKSHDSTCANTNPLPALPQFENDDVEGTPWHFDKPADIEQSGVFYFRKHILDELSSYFKTLRP
jgi:hypothetical protein